MLLIPEIQKMRDLSQSWRDKGESIAFVPTMGCLHAGHLSLVEKAQAVADHVVVSIFVNPLQFNDSEDLQKYPKTLDSDTELLTNLNIDALFIPSRDEFYPEGEDGVEQIDLGEITHLLEGAHRPGHFTGVATVVKRLFDYIQPTIAVFGEKDFQQLMVIQQLIERYSLSTKILAMPTAREQDGLAMSSRNLRLTTAERKIAPLIYTTLSSIKSAVDSGDTDYSRLEQSATKALEQAGFNVEYITVVNAATLLPSHTHTDTKVVLIAAKLGEIRLIDNLRL